MTVLHAVVKVLLSRFAKGQTSALRQVLGGSLVHTAKRPSL